MRQGNSTLLTVKQMVLIHTKYNEGTTKSIESSLCNYSDTYVLVTGNVTVEWADNNKTVAFKNSAPFRKCRTEINDAFIDDAEHINITVPMYNLIEYSGNFSNTSESLWQFKRDEIEGNVNLTVDTYPIPNNSSINQVLLKTEMV